MWNPFAALRDFLKKVYKVFTENLAAIWNSIKKPLFIAIIIFVVVAALGGFVGVFAAGSLMAAITSAIVASPLLALGATLFTFYLVDKETAQTIVESAGDLASDVASEVAEIAPIVGDSIGGLVGGLIGSLPTPVLAAAGVVASVAVFRSLFPDSGSSASDEPEYNLDHDDDVFYEDEFVDTDVEYLTYSD